MPTDTYKKELDAICDEPLRMIGMAYAPISKNTVCVAHPHRSDAFGNLLLNPMPWYRTPRGLMSGRVVGS